MEGTCSLFDVNHKSLTCIGKTYESHFVVNLYICQEKFAARRGCACVWLRLDGGGMVWECPENGINV